MLILEEISPNSKQTRRIRSITTEVQHTENFSCPEPIERNHRSGGSHGRASVLMEGVQVCPEEDDVDSVSLVRANVGNSISFSPISSPSPTGTQKIQTMLCSKLTMAGAQIKGHVMLEDVQLGDVDFRSVNVGGGVSASQSVLKGKVDLSAAVVAQNVNLERVRLPAQRQRRKRISCSGCRWRFSLISSP